MSRTNVLDGNRAAAKAVKQAKPDVVLMHSVIPAAPIDETIASLVANGHMDAEILNVESGHSALSACIGASAAGGRVFTSTASQALAQMHEMLFIASSLRLPIVLAAANRTLSSPQNTHADHSDTMSQRDCGWIQIYCENPQEVYDCIIQAYKIAEHQDVRTPVMVAMDGWVTSHSKENIHIAESSEVDEFIGKFSAAHTVLDSENPVTIGSMARADYYFEHKINQLQGIENARKVIKDVGKEFGNRFGRYYGYFESYKMDDADFAVLIMSSASGTAKEAVDRMRQQGEKVGLLKLRVFRPFPYKELLEPLTGLKAIAVLDRFLSPGTPAGPLFNEIRSALYDCDEERRPLVFPYIYGLGGRDIDITNIEAIFKEIKVNTETVETKIETTFVNLRQQVVE